MEWLEALKTVLALVFIVLFIFYANKVDNKRAHDKDWRSLFRERRDHEYRMKKIKVELVQAKTEAWQAELNVHKERLKEYTES